MAAIPLELTAKPGNWQLFTARKQDPRFRAFKQKVLERDNYTCQFCGFQAREFQEVVNIDHDYHNNKLTNMATACCFCAQCLFLESVGYGGYGGGTLIALPELTQAQLNSFCHVIFCAMANDTGYRESAQAIYRSFKFRSQALESHYGEAMAEPGNFGQLLIESGLEKDVLDPMMKDIRLLPSRAKFKMQIERWAANALAELAEE